ncbi:SET domain-containing protein-lysine N-methyltransferase [Patescibacteria group bacterium]|nr:MAG: SET domain-containing protein-lysine N-methyltransferase [Patescibacteria group bacterium]
MENAPYPKAKFEVRPSKIIAGEAGLFSLREFLPGEVVVPHSNWDESRLISWSEFEKIDPATKRQLIYFCYKTEEGVHAPQDINKLNIAYFMNHSCDPCVVCAENGDYVAKRKINVGEEFTIDVEALMQKHVYSFDCKCGSKNCRGVVKI